MDYDSTANASIPTVASNPKEFGKKKRVNRSAKLKQSKLDVRREQWLSQVKKKGFKEENKCVDLPKTPCSDMQASKREENRPMAKLVINPSGEVIDSLMSQYSDWESPSNSPVGHTSSLNSNISVVTSFTSSSSSSSSSGCYSGSMTEEDDGDDGCLDDWEAIADALAADEKKVDDSPQLEPVEMVEEVEVTCHVPVNHRAWRADDCCRPQGLPNLVKQNSFPVNTAWGFKNVGFTQFTPIACPICCEDLDLTDSSFVPCPCGYRLCLFCYKRIVEDNGRCPGCRKEYEQFDHGNTGFKLARSYSMVQGH